ncbi:sensor histidine kinase [Dermabacter sp. HSID17554]|uniref:sensor histidine kinase n=1 Tax=Dermabacter sp. HSID17554 TaxID=2419511 RepID=UPI000F88006C|nr:sensor histidine kinase [Dermabacter sp. HSID17554]RUP86707.1 sensor histidine kinase [Dermabacter sp. HSID17554]
MPTSARTPYVAGAAALACVLLGIPVLESAVSAAPHTTSVVIFSLVSLFVMLAGGVWLMRVGDIRAEPATVFSWRPLVYIAMLASAWAMVIAETPHATYFLFALIGIAQWLLPERTGALVTLGLTVFTIAGQVFHHGASTGTIVGPLLIAVLMLAFMHMYRAMRFEALQKNAVIAELRNAQGQLVESEREKARITERERLGRDLHDTTAQSLSSVILRLGLAEEALDSGESAGALEHVRSASDATSEALSELRSAITHLTPKGSGPTRLEAALVRVAETARSRAVSNRRGTTPVIECRVAPDLPELNMTTATSLVRIVQSSLANALDHAHASRIEVRACAEGGEVHIDIEDDGRGFDVDEALLGPRGDSGGYGLGFVVQRSRELGGNAAIIAAPGDGALISVTIPVSQAPSDPPASPVSPH